MAFPSLYPPKGGWTRWLCRVLSVLLVCLSIFFAWNGLYNRAAYFVAAAVWLRVVADLDYYEDR